MTQPLGRLRIARQGLAHRPAIAPVDAAALGAGLQAQDLPPARLGARARSSTLTDRDIVAALDVDRTLVRATLMRATLHVVPAADLRWLLALLGPSIARAFDARWRGLGLSAATRRAVLDALPAVLSDTPATAVEVAAALTARGVRLRDDPAARSHVLLLAATAGLACRGPDGPGRTPTYVAVDTWLPAARPGPSGDEALAELARRYFRAFSPATPGDFTAWSRLPSRRAIELLGDELVPVDVGGRRGYRLGEIEPARGVRLIPAFDNYLIGYRDRSAITDARHVPAVYQGGMIRPVVLLDGWVIGRWELRRTRTGVMVAVEPFDALSARVRAELAGEVADIGRFLDEPATLSID